MVLPLIVPDVGSLYASRAIYAAGGVIDAFIFTFIVA